MRRVLIIAMLLVSCRGTRDGAPPPASPRPPPPPPPASPDAPPAPVASVPDAGTTACGGEQRGTCPSGQTCVSCSQPARTVFFCASPCRTSADCTDPAKPSCEEGTCAQSGMAQRCRSKCAAPDTPILTPDGERAISSLRAGDLVLTVDAGRVVAAPVLVVQSTPAPGHTVARITLDSGRVLELSHGHPTADGRTLADLTPGMLLGDASVRSVESVPYPFDATWDILPSSDSGAYFAAGALVGSTLASLD